MEKKNYFEPKEEVIFLQMNSALLSGSSQDVNEEDNSAPSGDTPINPF